MSVQRQLNVLGQMRIDAAHIRSIESSIAKDFDLLAGNIVAGKHSYVVRGLTIPVNGVGTVTADRLVLRVAGATLIHPTASDPAAFFAIPDSEQNQPLSSTNEKVEGAFTANSVNYVGLDLIRIADPNSYDTVKFLDADTEEEAAKTIPLGRILDYRIVISPQSFSVQPHLLPIAKVTTDASNVVTKIEDARPLLFRLGSGGDSPNSQNRFDWGSRLDNRTSTSDASTDPFTLGDRSIRSQKDWMDAVMTRLWELGGGPSWFSPSSDRDIKVAYGPPLIGDWGNVSLTGDTLRWQSIQVLFANSPATANIVADETSGVSFPDGSCLCVDIDRETDQKVVHAKVFSIKNVGTPLVPGSRIIIAWRVGDNIFLKDAPYENGRSVPVATPESEGVVRLFKSALNPANPVVLTDSAFHNKEGEPVANLTVAAVKDDRLLVEGSKGDWTVDGSLISGASGDIGSASKRWNNVFASNIDASKAEVGLLDVDSVDSSLIPSTGSGIRDLGSSARRWNEGWFAGAVRANSFQAGNSTVTGNGSSLRGQLELFGNFVADADNTRDIGELHKSWRNGYFSGPMIAKNFHGENFTFYSREHLGAFRKEYKKIMPANKAFISRTANPMEWQEYGWGGMRTVRQPGSSENASGHRLVFSLNELIPQGSDARIVKVEVLVHPNSSMMDGQRMSALLQRNDYGADFDSNPVITNLSSVVQDNRRAQLQVLQLFPSSPHAVSLDRYEYHVVVSTSPNWGDIIVALRLTYDIAGYGRDR